MERQVFAALHNGPSNDDLAASLHITPRTAKFHIANLRTKLGGLSRLQVCLLAALEKLEIPAVCLTCTYTLESAPELIQSAQAIFGRWAHYSGR
ncbi:MULTISPECIES: helix-turn-helix domain-containing protein [unclassified Streptomyces]|uniref:helix-turn-helix domain-containing protein n=1 Tax=unclassified Streptomyces TaxID=2593676 RepID=UPI0013148F5E|nr:MULTISPECIES: helix-turn-helix transcriptional regulator [unclassified Streptomyces]